MAYDKFKEARNALQMSQNMRDALRPQTGQLSYQREKSPLEMGSLQMKPMQSQPIQEMQRMDIGEEGVRNPLEMGRMEMRPPVQQTPKPQTYRIEDRGIDLTDDDFSEAEPILFSEISNKEDQQETEMQHIMNTALNRVKQYGDKGLMKSLKEVFQMPNQYQGYKSPQYELAAAAATAVLDDPSKEKLEKVKKFLEKVKKEGLKDTTDGSVYYIHEPDGTLKLKEGKLFK